MFHGEDLLDRLNIIQGYHVGGKCSETFPTMSTKENSSKEQRGGDVPRSKPGCREAQVAVYAWTLRY